MQTEDDQLFGTLTMQIGQDGSQPVLFAVAPLGIAARPGVRIVVQPTMAEIGLPVDVCYPDGCRASADLSDTQLGQLAAAETLSVQFITFSDGTTLAADIPANSLIAPLVSAGVVLPDKG